MKKKEDLLIWFPKQSLLWSKLTIHSGKCAKVWECIFKLQKHPGLLYYVCLVQRGHSINDFVADSSPTKKNPKAPLWEQIRLFGQNSKC